jgi:hypothetical protein
MLPLSCGRFHISMRYDAIAGPLAGIGAVMTNGVVAKTGASPRSSVVGVMEIVIVWLENAYYRETNKRRRKANLRPRSTP